MKKPIDLFPELELAFLRRDTNNGKNYCIECGANERAGVVKHKSDCALTEAHRVLSKMEPPQREKVSEWWEVWLESPGKDTVRARRYGEPFDHRIPHEGFLSKAQTESWLRINRHARVVHVVRYKKKRRRHG